MFPFGLGFSLTGIGLPRFDRYHWMRAPHALLRQ
jgi:hypothetical protein